MKRKRAAEPLGEARRLQRLAAREGFDWDRREDLWSKLQEEIAELRADADVPGKAREELGDLLFMAVNLARHLGVDPAAALRAANRKFERRFAYILRHAGQLPPQGKPGRLARMEALWQEAKRRERERRGR